ncbi:hypothetical protein CesoFtcFv8_003301 [Champsocephalus esox]|uniref:Uncharacterized protein n=2 Tax=Champsocephalus TaxID=52236 RepID=A0AAN8I6B4_CHAGU|nr:hypothetical protein CesoFtcFv8_003301 [Champsocephalus esox]KAK5931989.1 hypothetical protein CgunFtcFv8_003729 [Champsocephalus gunnari]
MLFLLASLYPSLAAPEGFLTLQAATGRHIVQKAGGVVGCDGVWGRGGGTLCDPHSQCEKAFVFPQPYVCLALD